MQRTSLFSDILDDITANISSDSEEQDESGRNNEEWWNGLREPEPTAQPSEMFDPLHQDASVQSQQAGNEGNVSSSTSVK
jgi:hypothetical protein